MLPVDAESRVRPAADSYILKVFPDAREGFAMRSRVPKSRLQGPADPRPSPVLDYSPQLDDEKRRLPQHLRRARGRVRRYSVANGTNVLVSLTYAPSELERAVDRENVELDVRNTVRRMRWAWSERFPYVSMPEIQPERTEREGVPVYNGMILVPRLPRHVFDAVIDSWPYGLGDGYNGVDVTRWRSHRGGAQYATKALSRYAGKDLDVAPPGRQSYRVAEGYQPAAQIFEVGSSLNAVQALSKWAESVGVDAKVQGVADDEGNPLDASWGLW